MGSDQPHGQSARRRRLDDFARDATRAHEEYTAGGRATDERTAKLREERLARESARKATESVDDGERAARSPRGAKRAVITRSAKTTAASTGRRVATTAKSYRFKTGQRVRISGIWGTKSPGGVHRIVSQLPEDPRGNLYRVRSETEPHDRVVAESQLSAAE